MTIDWSKMPAREVAEALRTIPKKVALAWRREGSWWARDDVEEQGVAYAAIVSQRDDGTWKGPPVRRTEKHPDGWSVVEVSEHTRYETAEAAKTAYDEWLRQEGWLIVEDDDGSGGAPDGREIFEIEVRDEIVRVTEGKFESGLRVWWEVP